MLKVNRLDALLGVPRVNRCDAEHVGVVVEVGQERRLLIVDEVCEQQPVVIKPMGGVLETVGYFAGGALLAGGEIGFVLDLTSLFAHSSDDQLAASDRRCTA